MQNITMTMVTYDNKFDDLFRNSLLSVETLEVRVIRFVTSLDHRISGSGDPWA